MNSPGNVIYCTLCSKPFSNGRLASIRRVDASQTDRSIASSHKRHVAYCRRTQQRPKLRQKACRVCNEAKAKCSFGQPCARCTARGVDCIYTTGSKPAGRPSPSAPEIAMPTPPQDSDSTMNTVDLSEAVLQSSLGQRFVEEPWQITVDTILQDNMFRPSNDTTQATGEYSYTPSALEGIHVLDMLQGQPYQVMSPMTETLISSHGPIGSLRARRPRDATTQRDVNLLLQGLRALPFKMVHTNERPFFIHSYSHRDLPEPLAVCARICHMFDTRTPAILPFIWRCIRSEELRYLQEVCGMFCRD